MANFNYLDFFKTPSVTDKKLFIKDINNNVVWTIDNFKIKSYIVQNNNIRINLINEDFIIIDFNNIYESKIAISKLKNAIFILNDKVPFEINKDVKLYIDNSVAGTIGAQGATGSQGYIGPQGFQGHIGPQGFQGSIGPQGFQGSIGPQGFQGHIGPQGNQGDIGNTFTKLIPINDVIINTPTSFTFLSGAFSSTNIQTFESFDNSQGFYLQAIIPVVYDDLQGIFFGVYGHSYSYTIEIIQTSFDINPYGEYNLCYNSEILNSGTYSEEFRFSLYSDGSDVFYEINGINVINSTYSNDSYYFYSYPENTLLDNYTFSDVLFYPTGKKGTDALLYYATSSTTFQIPNVGDIVNIATSHNLGYTPGQTILVLNDLIDYYADSDYYEDGENPGLFYGIVDSYIPNSGTLSLVCVNSQQPGLTYSFWYLNLSGAYPDLISSSASTGDITFTYSTISTLNSNENIIIATKGTASLILIDDNSHTNFEIAGTNSWFLNQGDVFIHNNLILSGAEYYNPSIQNRNGDYGWTVLTTGTNSTVDIFTSNFKSAKYLASCEIQSGTYSVMTCEIIVSNSSNLSVTPVTSIYAITSTSGAQFVTFDVQRSIDNNFIELIAYTNETNCVVSLFRQYIIYGGVLPTVITTAVTDIGFNTATSGGTVINEGSSPVTARGVCINTTGNPTLSDSTTTDGSGIGIFISSITGMFSGTTYYVRAYATNGTGTTYGNQFIFETDMCLVAGTKILLSDRTYKNIEDINYEDQLMVWNFDEGKFDSSYPLWIKKPQTAIRYNLLKFSDGSELKTIVQHRIFNKEMEMFTYTMTEDSPIGTTTFNSFGKEIKLISKEVIDEKVQYYNIITDKHMNLFSNTILTSCKYNNIYPIVDMKFVKDNRIIRDRNEFVNIPDKYIDGLRLCEQTFDMD